MRSASVIAVRSGVLGLGVGDYDDDDGAGIEPEGNFYGKKSEP
jgi:hypothetical protein